jgi:hypothetical protein
MADIARNNVVDRVKSLIDELTPFTDGQLQTLPSLSSLDTIKRYIDNALDEATDAAMLLCNSQRMPHTALSGTINNVLLGDSGIIYQTIAIPADFLRVYFIKMAKWQHGITTIISVDSEQYKQMRNPYTTAGSAKPVAALNNGMLELYGSQENDTLLTSSYINKLRFATSLTTIDDMVLNAIAWRCAGEVLAGMERSEAFKMAKGFYEEAVKLTFI